MIIKQDIIIIIAQFNLARTVSGMFPFTAKAAPIRIYVAALQLYQSLLGIK
jgi:hypothetical protein